VLATALRQQIDDRILAVHALGSTLGHGEIEAAQVGAAQMICEIGGG
jgi:hypothetical protein